MQPQAEPRRALAVRPTPAGPGGRRPIAAARALPRVAR